MNEEYLCCMSEDLNIIAGTKAEQYESLIPQIKGLLEGEPDIVANLANIVAALKEQFDWLWIGFYLVKPPPKASTDKPASAKVSERQARPVFLLRQASSDKSVIK
jgi:hypothetical protein